MKRTVLISLLILGCAVVFGQKKTLYTERFAEAKEYEQQGLWIHALGCYYDAIDTQTTEDVSEAYNAFSLLEEAISNGNPGYGEYDEFDIYDGWKALQAEYEDYFYNYCPVKFTFSEFTKGNVDYEEKTADYTASVKGEWSEKYLLLKSIIRTGYRKAYKLSWTAMNPYWPGEKSLDNYKMYFKITDTEGNPLYNCMCTANKEYTIESAKIGKIRLIDNDAVKIVPEKVTVIKDNKRYVYQADDSIHVRTPYEPSFKDNSYAALRNAKKLEELKNELTNMYKMVSIEGGKFTMAPVAENKKNTKKVNLKNFEIGATEVNQELYERIMTDYTGGSCQIYGSCECLNWYDAIFFCNKLSALMGYTPCYEVNGTTNVEQWNYIPNQNFIITEKITCNEKANGYRLPTSVELEYTVSTNGRKAKVAKAKKNVKDSSAEALENPSVEVAKLSEEWCWGSDNTAPSKQDLVGFAQDSLDEMKLNFRLVRNVK